MLTSRPHTHTSHSVQTYIPLVQASTSNNVAQVKTSQTLLRPLIIPVSNCRVFLLPLPHHINGLAVTELQMISVRHYLIAFNTSRLCKTNGSRTAVNISSSNHQQGCQEFSKYYLHSHYLDCIYQNKHKFLESLMLMKNVSCLCRLLLICVLSQPKLNPYSFKKPLK